MFEIQTVDIRGVPTKVFVNAPPSLRATWEMSAAVADNVYLVYEDERITFADAAACARWCAGCSSRACTKVIALRSRHATPRVRRSGRSKRSARSACRSARGGPGPSSRTGSPTQAASCCSPTRAGRASPHLGETKVRATVLIRTDLEVGPVAWHDVAHGDDPPLPAVDIDPTLTRRSCTPRDDRPSRSAVQTQRNFGNF
jgi:hypothetical protein